MRLRDSMAAVILSIIAAPCAAQAQTIATAQHLFSDEQEIRRLQNEWMQAWVRQDRPKLERILAPEYALTVSSMPDRPISRSQWLGMLNRYTAESFEYDRMLVRLFGDFAVVSSIGRAIGAQVDGADRSFPFFLTDVWRKRQGRWQVVARYSSLPEGATKSSRALLNPDTDE